MNVAVLRIRLIRKEAVLSHIRCTIGIYFDGNHRDSEIVTAVAKAANTKKPRGSSQKVQSQEQSTVTYSTTD